MAGTIPLSMTQQLDVYGQPLAGGQLYIIQAGTVSTPQNAYADTGLTVLRPYPMTLDAAGRVPQFFLDNSVNATVKIRLQDASGVVQLTADEVLIIGPAGGSGSGGSTVDPSAIYQTGDVKPRYATGAHTGWVRGNGLTIGSATSGGTERANADCQALFQHLWGVDATLAVSGGRGANAAADWSANKQLSLPDYRGYNLAALDDMGNVPANRLAGQFTTSPIVLGAEGGTPTVVLATTNLPPHPHTGTTDGEQAHTHKAVTPVTRVTQAVVQGGTGSSSSFWTGVGTSPEDSAASTAAHNHTFSTSNSPGMNATPVVTISPRKLCTFYIKL